MAEKVENIHEKVNKLEKNIEELDKRVNVYLLPKKRTGDEEVSFSKRLSILGLVSLVLVHLVIFFSFSSKILDLSFERYLDFWMNSLCKFYQLFVHSKVC